MLKNVFQTFQRKAATISWYFRESAHIPRTVQVSTQSACSLSQLPNKSIDYVFTDPPFGANINYSEMNLIWESWLQKWTDTTEEAIVNSVQGKSYEDYQNILIKAFIEIKRVLKDKSWLTVAFHNSSEKVWMVIQKALADAGFEIKGTQIFDKKHGTFKMFVSENAVGYDLILHCQKSDNIQIYTQKNIQIHQNNDQIVQQNIIKFIKKYLAQEKSLTKSFLHVSRQPEFDYRRLYSKWLATAIKDSLISISFESFRELIDKIKLENKQMHRVWLTESTKRELERLVGSLDTTIVSETILKVVDQLGEIISSDTDDFEIGYPILLTQDAYAALQEKLPGVNDDHCFRLLTQYLRHKND